MQNAPAIIEIVEENETFKSGVFDLAPVARPGHLIFGVVAQQFQSSWRHATTCPTVRAVYQIVSTQQDIDKYNSYRYALRPFPYPKCDPHGAQLQRFCGSSWQLHRGQPITRQREPAVARDAEEMYPWRQGLHDLLFRCSMLLVLHCQDFVRSGPVREEHKLGKVRCWNLYIIYIFQVRITLPFAKPSH